LHSAPLPLAAVRILTESKRPILVVSPVFLQTIKKGVDVGTPEERPRLYAGGVELCIGDSLPYTNEAGGEVHVLAIDGDLRKTRRFWPIISPCTLSWTGTKVTRDGRKDNTFPFFSAERATSTWGSCRPAGVASSACSSFSLSWRVLFDVIGHRNWKPRGVKRVSYLACRLGEG
jgi:hypothetical protein